MLSSVSIGNRFMYLNNLGGLQHRNERRTNELRQETEKQEVGYDAIRIAEGVGDCVEWRFTTKATKFLGWTGSLRAIFAKNSRIIDCTPGLIIG